MDNHLKTILDNYEDVKNGTSVKTCVCIHGERGSGKTNLLESLKDTLLKNGSNVYFSIGMEDDEALREILRQLVRLYGDKFDTGLVELITSYIQGALTDNPSPEESPEFTKDSIIKFIYDCVKTEPIVFVIDNIDKIDSFTINLLSNLLMIDVNVFLIITLSEQVDSIILSDMLYRNSERIMYVKLTSPTQMNIKASDEQEMLIDEVMLVLTKPGREKQLIKHYLKLAEDFIMQLSYEKAIENFSAALDVSQSINDKETQLSALICIGDARVACKEFTDSIDNYLIALQLADEQDLQQERILILIKLSNCFDMIGKHDTAREYVMITEAFFALADNRSKFYELYSKHIIKYLFLLLELGEDAVFLEKLSQARKICRSDDKKFICALNCEEGYMYMHSGNYTAAHDKLTLTRNIAKKLSLSKMWEEATNSLAICNEHMGKANVSLKLWNEIIKNSHDPVRWAGAMVNAAIMRYEQNGDKVKAINDIMVGIELCILAGEDKIAADISENLQNTPLAEDAIKRLSQYRLQKSI